MQWLIKWGVKKWLVGVVNTALIEYRGMVTRARAYLYLAICKVEAVTAFLRSLDEKLADNKVTEAEAEAAVKEAAELAQKLVAKN